MTDIADIMAKAMYELRPVGVRDWADCPTREAGGLREQARAALTALQEHGFVVVDTSILRLARWAIDDASGFACASGAAGQADIVDELDAILAAYPGSSGKKKVRTVGEPGENMGIGYPKKD